MGGRGGQCRSGAGVDVAASHAANTPSRLDYLTSVPTVLSVLGSLKQLNRMCWHVLGSAPALAGLQLPGGPWLCSLQQLALPAAMFASSQRVLAAAQLSAVRYSSSGSRHLAGDGTVLNHGGCSGGVLQRWRRRRQRQAGGSSSTLRGTCAWPALLQPASILPRASGAADARLLR